MNEQQDQRYDRFVGLLARHDQSVRRFIRSLLPSADGVDDVMQDTALECWKKFSDYEAGENTDEGDGFVRWACVIARYKVLSRIRDRSRDRLVFRESVIERLATTSLDQLDRQAAEREAVDDCLEKLPEDRRRLVLSVHTPGDSVARIAEETGQKARRLYSLVNNLRQTLLDCIRQRVAQEGL